MLKSDYGFDEVTGHMHCLVLVTAFQGGYQKAGHFTPSLKEENTVSIDTLLDHTAFMHSY